MSALTVPAQMMHIGHDRKKNGETQRMNDIQYRQLLHRVRDGISYMMDRRSSHRATRLLSLIRQTAPMQRARPRLSDALHLWSRRSCARAITTPTRRSVAWSSHCGRRSFHRRISHRHLVTARICYQSCHCCCWRRSRALASQCRESHGRPATSDRAGCSPLVTWPHSKTAAWSSDAYR